HIRGEQTARSLAAWHAVLSPSSHWLSAPTPRARGLVIPSIEIRRYLRDDGRRYSGGSARTNRGATWVVRYASDSSTALRRLPSRRASVSRIAGLRSCGQAPLRSR